MKTNNHSIRVEVGREPLPEHLRHPSVTGTAPGEAREPLTPPIDIHEGAEGLILEADLPGSSEQDVQVQLEENVLTLHARVNPAVPEGSRALHEEYPLGDYSRSFILSDEVERGKIIAEFKNGVLRVTLPKAERAKTRRIEIKS